MSEQKIAANESRNSSRAKTGIPVVNTRKIHRGYLQIFDLPVIKKQFGKATEGDGQAFGTNAGCLQRELLRQGFFHEMAKIENRSRSPCIDENILQAATDSRLEKKVETTTIERNNLHGERNPHTGAGVKKALRRWDRKKPDRRSYPGPGVKIGIVYECAKY